MRGDIGRGRLLSPRSARRSTPGETGACYNFLYEIKHSSAALATSRRSEPVRLWPHQRRHEVGLFDAAIRPTRLLYLTNGPPMGARTSGRLLG